MASNKSALLQKPLNPQTERGSGEERWAVEIKWRGRLAGVKELQRLLAAARTLAARPWFISRAGFTTEAKEFAKGEGIMLSSQAEIERLAKVVRLSHEEKPRPRPDF